jgi:hypothetical protein
MKSLNAKTFFQEIQSEINVVAVVTKFWKMSSISGQETNKNSKNDRLPSSGETQKKVRNDAGIWLTVGTGGELM